MRPYLMRYPLLVYFLLVYVIAWGGALVVAATRSFDPAAIELAHGGLMFLFMVAATLIAGLGLTAFYDGRAGLRELWSRVTHWRVSLHWYAMALLTTPLVTLLVLFGFNALVSPNYAPGFVPMLLVAGLLAGFLEEIGWSGFATPRLLRRYSLFRSGLTLGILWALWHLMAGFWGSSHTFGAYWLPDTLAFWIVGLVAYRILMTWVYSHTRSILVAQLMHGFFSGIVGVFDPGTAPAETLNWHIAFAIVMWLVVGAVFLLKRSEFTEAPELTPAQATG